MQRTTFLNRLVIGRVAGVLAMLACATAGAADARFSWTDGLRVRSDDKQWRLDLGGIVSVDSAWYNADVTPLDDDTIFRRLRPQLSASYGEHWKARLDYEFGDVADGWKNAWIQYEFTKHLDLRLGNQTVPFGLEEVMGSSDLAFMERPLVTHLTPGLLTGALLRADNQDMSLSFGVFGNDAGSDDQRKLSGTSVTSRITWAPIRANKRVLHLGLSAEYRSADSGESARFRARPESDATNVRLIDTRSIVDVDSLIAVGAELAAGIGPALVQAEYIGTRVSRNTGADLNFGGWYVSTAYVITGERRHYKSHTGSFGDISPRGQWGAVEVAARYGSLDLTDADITGGEESNLALGVNWYLNSNCRLMLNYIDIDASPNKNGVNESPSLWQIRAQVGF
jgi:phosphate-selective porin OprO/OprP